MVFQLRIQCKNIRDLQFVVKEFVDQIRNTNEAGDFNGKAYDYTFINTDNVFFNDDYSHLEVPGYNEVFSN